MKRSAGLALVAIVAAISIATAGGNITTRLTTVNGIITLQWTTGDESNIDGFLIERAIFPGTEYLPILQNKIEPRGAGSTYVYEDAGAMKTATARYTYHLVVLGTDGSRTIIPFQGSATPGNGSPSDIKRTWGSIKAMFR